MTAWNERQAKRMPMLFSPTIGAAITAGYWFLRARGEAASPHDRQLLLESLSKARSSVRVRTTMVLAIANGRKSSARYTSEPLA